MNEKIGYRVNATLKEDYDNFILNKYGHKRNKCGSELEKAIKLYLASQGNVKYKNDPDIDTTLKRKRFRKGSLPPPSK